MKFENVVKQIYQENIKNEQELLPLIKQIESKTFTGITLEQYEILKTITKNTIKILTDYESIIIKKIYKLSDKAYKTDKSFNSFMDLTIDYNKAIEMEDFFLIQLETSKDLIRDI